jgi:hypothetical protein
MIPMDFFLPILCIEEIVELSDVVVIEEKLD